MKEIMKGTSSCPPATKPSAALFKNALTPEVPAQKREKTSSQEYLSEIIFFLASLRQCLFTLLTMHTTANNHAVHPHTNPQRLHTLRRESEEFQSPNEHFQQRAANGCVLEVVAELILGGQGIIPGDVAIVLLVHLRRERERKRERDGDRARARVRKSR
jgi:hypothetical protein